MTPKPGFKVTVLFKLQKIHLLCAIEVWSISYRYTID